MLLLWRSIPFHIVVRLFCCTEKLMLNMERWLDHYHQHTITNVLYFTFSQWYVRHQLCSVNDVNSKSKTPNTLKRMENQRCCMLTRYLLFMIKVNRKLWTTFQSSRSLSLLLCTQRRYIFRPINVLIHSQDEKKNPLSLHT